MAHFEIQITGMNIVKENWVIHLLNLLPLEIVNIISEEVDKLTSDYNHLKILLLERFQMMPKKFRQKFISHKKDHSPTWSDLAFDLRNYLEE